VSEVFGGVMIVLILVVGTRLALGAASTLDPAVLITFLAVSLRLMSPIKSVSNYPAIMASAVASAERVFEVLDLPAAEFDRPGETTAEFSERIEFRGVSFEYEASESVLRDVDLEVKRGQVVAIVGPSGAGKTTTLRAVAGLVAPDEGRVEANGTVWFDRERGIDLPPERRSVGLVFQDYLLFPHMTVAENVAFGGRERAFPTLERLGISELADARPRELSGGERQRVAIARALARDPAVLLLDEPLAALDVRTRVGVRGELHALLRDLGLPTLVVTHDFEDAASLADRIVVVDRGRVVQAVTAQELIAHPEGRFVAEFAGANLLPGRARRIEHGLTEVTLDDGTRLVSADPGEGAVGLAVYPWEVTVARSLPADSTRNHVRGRISSLVPVGNRVRVQVGPLTAEITSAAVQELALQPGDTVVASFKATGTRLVPLG
jgi:molybdate transport system ATP-binding protein